jgi:uncharacterized protein (TIGR02117 family)
MSKERMESDAIKRPRTKLGCLWRLVRAVLGVCLAGLVAYVLACLVGLIPVNRGFRNADGGIEIFVYADQAHSEIIVPVTTETIDWRGRFAPEHFRAFDERADFVAFGWGDHDFFLQTPRWADLKPGTTLKAMLFPTRTVMHVSLLRRPAEGTYCRRLVLTRDQYERLCEHLAGSFQKDAGGQLLLIANSGYGDVDTFYLARGKYHFLNTCNNWTGRGLQKAGVRTGLWTPYTVGLAQVPREEDT